jgi:hypothetical protein
MANPHSLRTLQERLQFTKTRKTSRVNLLLELEKTSQLHSFATSPRAPMSMSFQSLASPAKLGVSPLSSCSFDLRTSQHKASIEVPAHYTFEEPKHSINLRFSRLRALLKTNHGSLKTIKPSLRRKCLSPKATAGLT